MTLNRREKILAGLSAALVIGLAAWFLVFSGDSRSRSVLRAARDRLAGDVEKKEARVQAAARAAVQVREWERRALPSEPHNARSLYQTWLRTQAERASLERLTVDSSEGQSRRNTYTTFTFTVRGRSRPSELVQFLYQFYSAGHLQQIRRLDIKPVEDSSQLEINMVVEAMSLPGADRKAQLTTEVGKGLTQTTLAAYRDPIIGRNLFAKYSMAPKQREERPTFDSAKYAFVTGIVKDVDGRQQVWVQDRTAGKTWRLHEGEEFQIGQGRGKVKSIAARDAVIEFEGRPRRLTSGDALRGGTEEPADK